MDNPLEILKQYWHYESFRPLQLEIIQSALDGRDTLALMPTGGGKSVCFQVPSLMRDGLCLVISPLIALMKDQTAHLKELGIPVLYIHSGMRYAEIQRILQNVSHGTFKFLYVSPERLETSLFLEYLPSINVNFIAVDEAHCISQWGYDFRPSYLKIAALRKLKKNVPILAVTASATREVQNDICDKLEFRHGYQKFSQSFERKNLSYSVFSPPSRQKKIIEILSKVNGSAIIYCKSRKRTQELENLLKLNGISVGHYHAGLSPENRNKVQDDWIRNKIRTIACTNAFGMGIDKSNVRIVIHYDVPESLENYYQEAGRAGRDGKKAYAILLYNARAIADLKLQSSIKYPDIKTIRKVYASLVNYLQLATGSGKDVFLDFNIGDFGKKFSLEAPLIDNVLRILQQEELISYEPQLLIPSTVVFTANRDELEYFEKGHPQYDIVIKGLLRSYEGIFDFPSYIEEDKLSRIVSLTEEKVKALLTALNKFRILKYVPRNDKPKVRFLHNRVRANDLLINYHNLKRRKEAFEVRVNAIIKYLENDHTCRSKIIANYFSDTQAKDCGICDNCLKRKKVSVSKVEFQEIWSLIQNSVSRKPTGLEQLLNDLSTWKKDKIIKVLDYLQAEDKVYIDNVGIIKLKKVQK
jgi:ATP-dependent DNA helicase RecQ